MRPASTAERLEIYDWAVKWQQPCLASRGMEVQLAPLAGPDGEVDRYIGLYQPTAPLQRLNDEVVEPMLLHSIQWADPAVANAPALRLATLDGRRIA